MAFILIPLAVATYQRNRIWKEDLTLWQDVVRKAPGKARGHNNLGRAYWKMGRPEEALKEFQVALTLNPKHAKAQVNLGVIYHDQGRYDEAIQVFERAITVNPRL